MDINEAVVAIEAFLDQYKSDTKWNAEEIRVRTSGDDMNAIKIWFGFPAGTSDSDLDSLKQAAIDALKAAHSELSSFTLEVRAETL